ncbi:hypothetical protein SME02_001601 [Klebsiella aerogenes]|nr:hypothetical protein [Klebsiella aerogenes]ELY3084611.1 hypothetical protein [Klebsiella aerogenes]
MNERLVELKDKLDNINTTLTAMAFPAEYFSSIGAYTHPFLSQKDLAGLPKMLSERISQMHDFIPATDDVDVIDAMINALENSQSNIAHINHGNAQVSQFAMSAYLTSMLYISERINNLFSFEKLKDKSLLPKAITRRLELYNSNLSSIEIKAGNVEEKIKIINDAFDAAENLPTTVKNLRETNEEVKSVFEKSNLDYEKISKILESAKTNSTSIEDAKDLILKLKTDTQEEARQYLASLKDEAQTYIDKCEEAFRTTTSKGLAGAFQDKAEKLNKSIRWWVGGLVVALTAGAFVGYTRLHALEAYLSSANSSGLKLTIQLILSVLSVGAPLWFAWLSTKQIGQRFRLAEDYEFKASVSKAYEGYRREAVQLDSDFTQRLFGNALTRLEEPPLRFVEETAYSSPIMEMLSSENFKKLLENGGDKLDSVLDGVGLSRKGKPEAQVKKDVQEITQESDF